MLENFCEIPITAFENISVGHQQDQQNATGVTVIYSSKLMPAGVDVRGGGPASKETTLLNPLAAAKGINALCLCGGSAYGLDATSGVMQYLEEKHIGFETKDGVVPLVCASSIYDLGLVNSKIRPDKNMGYQACVNGENSNCQSGNIGVGIGATVGKLFGPKNMMKSGLGYYGMQIGALKIGAIVVVNALGDVFDYQTNQKLAGLTADNGQFLDTETEFSKLLTKNPNLYHENTTIGTIITNAKFDKTQMNKIAAVAQNGLVRTIRPVHTSYDGDSVYALSCGELENVDLDIVGMLASTVMAKAINQAVLNTKSLYGIKACKA